jgi:hypothetical protein
MAADVADVAIGMMVEIRLSNSLFFFDGAMMMSPGRSWILRVPSSEAMVRSILAIFTFWPS